ncbi:hypothetical protein TWF481_000122 [Arthrobotrys musiformis]|uniref:Uncharacterized protein n=1 Tax=Arthrobotrys musiformis TaxID=47236 RepID=A0AAV9WSD6_9PEZI
MQPMPNPPLPSGPPDDSGKHTTFGGIAYTPQPPKTICGIRRRIFFVILAVAIIAIIGGLSAGLGVAVSKNNSAAAATVTVTAGASAGSPGRTTPSGPENTSENSSSGGSPTDSSGNTRSTATGTTTLSGGPPPSGATPFSIGTGFSTITFSKYSTSGELCSFFNDLHPLSTVVEPWIRGDANSGYGASWAQTSSQVVVTNPSTTVTIQGERYTATGTFLAEAVTNVPAWDFKKSTVPTVYGCEFTGSVHLLFEETGRMRYIISVDLADTCAIGTESVQGGATCSLYWRLVRST